MKPFNRLEPKLRHNMTCISDITLYVCFDGKNIENSQSYPSPYAPNSVRTGISSPSHPELRAKLSFVVAVTPQSPT